MELIILEGQFPEGMEIYFCQLPAELIPEKLEFLGHSSLYLFGVA
jgi:hypothetical protein